VRVPPGALGCLHVKSKIFGTPWVSLDVHSTIAIPLGQPTQESTESVGGGLLHLGHPFLLLLGLMRVLNDGMPVEWGAVVHLQDDAELVRVDEIDHTDGHTDHEAKSSCGQNEPKAPAELKLEHDRLKVDTEFTTRQQPKVHHVGEQHHGASHTHQVGTVPRYDDQQDVHEEPEGEGGPKKKVIYGVIIFLNFKKLKKYFF
jgi:hypothetical protein